ncbi:ribonuclease Z [Corchorus capsularis]|uniref:Ribonuclease Z n=1 Tax=Corchorus capsularis TaxID=210143 RepID=A0A1R3JIK7_COCAP|nr:ribonuclease Z [Corchorus capsularis]
MSQFSVQNVTSLEDDDLDMMSPFDSNHVSPSYNAAIGNKKAKKNKKSVDKEKDVGEGIKEAIEKVVDAIRTSGELLGRLQHRPLPQTSSPFESFRLKTFERSFLFSYSTLSRPKN